MRSLIPQPINPCGLCYRTHERTPEDLETIYEELVHIRALSHLSTTVKRELANVIVFESHPRAGTVRKFLDGRVSANLFNCSVADMDWWLNKFTGNLSQAENISKCSRGPFLFHQKKKCSGAATRLNEMILMIRSSSLAVFNQGDEGTSWYVILKVSSAPNIINL